MAKGIEFTTGIWSSEAEVNDGWDRALDQEKVQTGQSPSPQPAEQGQVSNLPQQYHEDWNSFYQAEMARMERFWAHRSATQLAAQHFHFQQLLNVQHFQFNARFRQLEELNAQLLRENIALKEKIQKQQEAIASDGLPSRWSRESTSRSQRSGSWTDITSPRHTDGADKGIRH